jgi:hypothetical protein
MASEETPLLIDQNTLDHEAVYNRFSPGHKRVIVAITAFTGTFPRKFSVLKASVRRRLNKLLSLYFWLVCAFDSTGRS